MTIDALRQLLIDGHSEIAAISRQLQQRATGHLLLTGLHASMRSVVLSALREQDSRHTVHLIVCDNDFFRFYTEKFFCLFYGKT